MIDAVVESLGKMGIKVYISGNSGNKVVGNVTKESPETIRQIMREICSKATVTLTSFILSSVENH